MKAAGAPALLVLGATGSLGSAVCAAAARAIPGARVLRASRHAEGPDAFRADVQDPASLAAAFRAADVAICAVGPFEYDPAPAIRACAAEGCHWIDLGDRARFVAAAEAAAKDAAIAVVSGASVVPGLVEALAAPLARVPGAAQLRAWWSLGSRKAVSGALLYALLRPLGRRDATGEVRPGRITRRRLGGAPFWFGSHPWPRGTDAHVADRTLPIALRVGMDHRAQAAALRALAPLLGRVPEPALLRAASAVQPATAWIQRLGSPRGALAVEALDFAGRALGAVEIAAESGLDVAAFPPVWAARALLAADLRVRGAVRLDALLPPPALAAAMREAGWIVTGF
ncbi:MAG TPA: hypothetical protein VNE71_12300 [Myxococcota bacterium]|nr:hypothetical protein [Myxococcota bacterium]